VSQYAFKLLLQAFEMDESDLKISRGGQGFASKQLKDRKTVGATATAVHPTGAFLDAAASVDLKFLDIDDTALKYVQEQNPGFFRYEIPANTYRGQTKPVRTMATRTMLIANIDMPEKDAYWLTKTLVEKLPVIRKSHSALRELTPEIMARPPAIELHPGAKKYFSEAGFLN
jgi:TRAP transporter TAXI family solute receptor